MDTIRLSNIAEELISHKLQRAGMLVAKPKFDQMGTDLLAFIQMGDGVKFCRIQCKGRSLKRSNSNIKIRKAYVTDGFVVVLYLDTSPEPETLYCSFAKDVRQWHTNNCDEYQLTLRRTTVKEKLGFYLFDDSKVKLITSPIRSAESSGEFRGLVYGNLHATGLMGKVVMQATVMPPERAACRSTWTRRT